MTTHMPRRAAITVAVLCLALGGCAGVATKSADRAALAPLIDDNQASAYGKFLAGQAAVNRDDTASAETYFTAAARLDPGDDRGRLTARAFTSALLTGDIARAAQLAPGPDEDDKTLVHLGALAKAVVAMSAGKAKLAHEILVSRDSGAPNEPAVALLTPYAAAAAGDAAASIIHPVLQGQPVAQFFASLDQGELFERAHRFEEAETAYRSMIAKGDPGGAASLRLGQMFERKRRFADALNIYDAALGRTPGDGDLTRARARATAHGPAPKLPPLHESAAEAILAAASGLMVDKHNEISLAYLRLALKLDPSRDEAWILVGDILAQGADQAGARAAYAQVTPASGQYVVARSKLAWNLQDEGDKDAALATARDVASRVPNSKEAQITLADLYRADELYDDSRKVLNGLIGDKPEQADWKLLYLRATDEEETDHWDDAEKDLKLALIARPNEAELLNFLGYSWIDRGVNLTEAMAMVQRAVHLQPDSGAIIDSLGWGYFRMGDFAEAVSNLERAAVLEPGDPDVNNHLGDAYWRVGRRDEAVFQWRRVLTLDPSPKLKAEVEGKIASGLAPRDAGKKVASN